ncbi:MAG: zf-HC2 domain-containing protein, partial [Mycobacterium sp.]
TVFVIVDAQHGAVTSVRILTHIPAALGALLALLVWRRWSKPAPDPTRTTVSEESIALPRNASRGRRRDHLWSTDGAA